MEKNLQSLKTYLAEIADLSRAQAVLNWDQQTYMPPGGAEDRGNQLSTLAKLEHERWTSGELDKLLGAAENIVSFQDPDSDDTALVLVTRKEMDKRTRVPAGWVTDFAYETIMGQEAWVKARKAIDFNAFRPNLERIVELRRAYAGFFAPYDHIYDPLLDDFEPGMKTADVRAIFAELRSEQVSLIKIIAARPQVDTTFLQREFSEQVQWDFGVEVIKRFGYDFNRGRLDRAPHPFSTGFGLGDVRITTRFDPEYPNSALFGTMHECGHALYEMGFDPVLARSPLADGASMAIHESQSRMWENLVGRSLPFWKFFYPRMQQVFPQQLSAVSLEDFYKGINCIQPSLIRVEADEATYNLHIMLRLELEIALMEGSLEVKDLPDAWNQRMQDYLGLTPPNDAMGVMQDIHWSGGSIGYFPTYALGNLVSVQLWEKVQSDIPDLDEQIQHGEFSALLTWLRLNVHRHGRKYEPQSLVQRITGSQIDPQPYLRYLKAKYSEIYGF